MSWTPGASQRQRTGSVSYSALPSSPSPSALPLPPVRHLRSPRSQRLTVVLILLAATLVGSALFVPHEQVQQAVAKAKEAYQQVKAGVVSASWPLRGEQAGVHEADEGLPTLVDPWVEDAVVSEEKSAGSDGGLKQLADVEDEQDLDHAVILPLPLPKEESEAEEDAGGSTWEPEQDEVEEEVAVVCSSELKEAMDRASFWVVRETAPFIYSITSREQLDSDISSICLSQAVFSARLISSAPPTGPDPQSSQTLVSLAPPILAEDLASYELIVPSDLAVPRDAYELDVRLEFGLYVGAMEGTNCGEGAKSCDPLKLSGREGPELKYLGERVEVQQGSVVEIGGADLAASLPLCETLSAISGYWSNLSFHPTSPSPCALATPSYPLSFIPPAQDAPLWIHFVGDSNSRNTYSRFLAALGGGRKHNAPIVLDSPTHNGTTASIAFRWRSGEMPEDEGNPDLVVTWNWWYQTAAPSSASPQPSTARTDEERETEWNSTVAANRNDLVRLVNGTLEQYLQRSNMASALSSFPALRGAAPSLRPHRTYLSLGSHGEELTVPGVASSLDELCSPSFGVSRSMRDAVNLRLFTTTLVNARYIPLSRFPHQDLVRTNALISAKNAYAASRPEFANEGRVIDVEQLTRGIVEEDGWMKPTKTGPDAVHFREEVYDEWVRLIWTDLMQGVELTAEAQAVSVEAARKRWKRRIAWDERDEED
ncbi:hypothetical protein JCM10213_001011 [Rhodosporidiobolus nylandii]